MSGFLGQKLPQALGCLPSRICCHQDQLENRLHTAKEVIRTCSHYSESASSSTISMMAKGSSTHKDMTTRWRCVSVWALSATFPSWASQASSPKDLAEHLASPLLNTLFLQAELLSIEL